MKGNIPENRDVSILQGPNVTQYQPMVMMVAI